MALTKILPGALGAGAVDSTAAVATGAIQADDLQAGTVTANKLGAGSVVSGVINTACAIDLNDNIKTRWGTSQDLEIYHDATNSVIDNKTGDLYIKSVSDVFITPGTTEAGVYIRHNGAVELYYDNAKKFQTASHGINIENPSSTSFLAQVSTSAGVAGFIKGNSSTDLGFQDSQQHWTVKGIKDGAVELYYNNSKKLETNAYGVKVSGDLYLDDNTKYRCGTGNDLAIYHDGSHSYITNSTGYLHLASSTIEFKNAANNETMLKASQDGAVELYYDNSKKLETHASNGVQFPGGLQAPDTQALRLGSSNDLLLYHDGSNSYINNSTSALYLRTGTGLNVQNAGGTETYLYTEENGAVFLRYDNSTKLETYSSGVEFHGNLKNETDGSNNGIYLGASNDLSLYHNNGDSFIRNSGGYLMIECTSGDAFLRSDNDIEIQPQGGENGIKVIGNGSVELFYDSARKFYTSNDGIEIPDGSGFTNRTSGTNKGWYVQYGGSTVARLYQNGTGPEGILELFNSGTQKILVNGDNGVYYGVSTTISALSSERRTKENITSIDDTKSWSTLKDIKLYSFSYKNDTNSDTHYGPIVDEIPTDMKVPTSNSDDVGVINTYNSELLLFRAYSTIKQLVEKVETLETKVAALEAG